MAVNFAVSGARAQARVRARDPRSDVRQAVAGWRDRQINSLKEMGVVIPLSDWLGHNNGPPLLESTLVAEYCWRKARQAAFAPPDLHTGRRWALLAEKLGLSYIEYRLELLERGRHPTDEDAARIRAARTVVPRLPDM